LNRSAYSAEVSSSPTGEDDLVVHFPFDGNTLDNSINLNHSASYASASFGAAKVGSKAIVMNGKTFLQLPPTVSHQEEMTIAAWVYWNGGDDWQRIFDFGNGESEYMFLSPSSAAEQLHFGIKNGGAEQALTASQFPKFKWTHVAMTIDADSVRVYVNGEVVAGSNTITIRPMDLKTVANYIGRSQFAGDPFFLGNIDDFRIYNHVLPPDDIAKLAGVFEKEITTGARNDCNCETELSFWPVPANDLVHIDHRSENTRVSVISISDVNGREVLSNEFSNEDNASELNVSALPSGIYMLKYTNGKQSLVKKLVVRH
jgi:hypothetical protein